MKNNFIGSLLNLLFDQDAKDTTVSNLKNLDKNLDNLDLKSLKNNVEELDILDDEDYAKFTDMMYKLKQPKTGVSLIDSLINYLNKNIDTLLDNAKQYRIQHLVDNQKWLDKEPCKDVDTEAVRDEEIKDEQPDFLPLPSTTVKVNDKLKIHNLVNEFVNKYLKETTLASSLKDKDINDIYAYIFEYSCWLRNK